MNKRNFTRILGGAAAAMALPRWALAQAKGTAVELAAYTGADRQQRLVDGAKKEGPLSLYTSAQSDDMGALIAGFEKKYGLKTTTWRAGMAAGSNGAGAGRTWSNAGPTPSSKPRRSPR